MFVSWLDGRKMRIILLYVVTGLLAVVLASNAFAQGAGIMWDTLHRSAVEKYKSGEYDEAETLAKEALNLAVKNVGDDHPDVATTLNTLMTIYEAQGRISGVENYIYEPLIGGEKLTEKELIERINKPIINPNTGKPYNYEMVKKGIKSAAFNNTPIEYYNYLLDGYHLDVPQDTYGQIDKAIIEGISYPLIYYKYAKPSKYSYVRSFSFGVNDPLAMLPVDLILWQGSNEKEVIRLAKKHKKSWRSVSPNARILKSSTNEIAFYDTFSEDINNRKIGARYKGNSPSDIITIEVKGDLNNDSYEDILISYAHYNVSASGRYYGFAVLTKTPGDDILRDITEEVDSIVWKRPLNVSKLNETTIDQKFFSAQSQYELGLNYYNGRGVTKSDEEAVKCFRKAAEQGLPVAQYNLALMYYYGEGVAQDYNEAARWYKKAAELGHKKAKSSLNAMYKNGEATRIDSEELYKFGLNYYNGNGVKKDRKMAVKLLREAANQGNYNAQRALGFWWFGPESHLSDEEVAKWLRMAAEKGDGYEQYRYGVKCLRGEGVVQDDKEAEKWFRKAAKQGDDRARNLIEIIDVGNTAANSGKNELIKVLDIDSKTKEKRIYYKNGQLATKLYYIDGKVTGIYKSYYPSGNIMINARYENGYLDGKYEQYSYDGNLDFEVLYVDGKQSGKKIYKKNKVKNIKKYSSKWTIFGDLNGTLPDFNGNYFIKYNDNGAIIKKEKSNELIYLGRNCDVYSESRGNGTWRFHKFLPAFSIHFDNDESLSSNIYGYGLKDYDWYEKMPNRGSECHYPYQKEIIPANSCSSDPLFNTFQGNIVSRLATHGWRLNIIDFDSDCSGTGMGYCRLTAQDCTGRILYIETFGGYPPDGILEWAISGPIQYQAY